MLERLGAFLRSSIGKKSLMSATGLLLILYLVAHLAGNLSLFADDTGESFDAYATLLQSNPLLPFAEIGLLVLFVAHIALGLRTASENREARQTRYKELASHGNRTVSSMSMVITGLIVLVFVVIHLWDFRITPRNPEGLAFMVVTRLATPAGAAIYVVGVLALGVHLWHAWQSSLQTLGVSHGAYTAALRRFGYGLAVVLGVGFASFPVLIYLFPREAVLEATDSAQRAAPQVPAPTVEEQR